LLSANQGIHKYKVTSKRSKIESTIITFDVNKKSILRIEYEYNKLAQPDASYIVIDYTKFRYPNAFNKNTFSTKGIFDKTKISFRLLNKYSSYDLTDLYH